MLILSKNKYQRSIPGDLRCFCKATNQSLLRFSLIDFCKTGFDQFKVYILFANIDNAEYAVIMPRPYPLIKTCLFNTILVRNFFACWPNGCPGLCFRFFVSGVSILVYINRQNFVIYVAFYPINKFSIHYNLLKIKHIHLYRMVGIDLELVLAVKF